MGKYEYIDMSYLEELALGSNEFKAEMIESFLKSTPESITQMKEAISAANWKTVGRVAHKLKTSFSFVGMENMVQLSKEIQDASLEAQNIEEIPRMVEELADCYLKSEVELEKELEELKNN
jgi:HPt (histidine-containing phosphotransfer) domain-containing protein